ncbi:MAG: B12-binding domain-containing radical SAM protein [Candidatus Rokubacteria bacterium]|nr:B12-binding domain-containing radical SAM protein [Candidatus Rokubacteria bacterium]
MPGDERVGTVSKLNFVRDPKFLLMYSPLQFRPDDSAKPDGSLALPYLAAALRQQDYEVAILDACVGNERHSLKDTFYHKVELPNGLIRIGMSPDDIAKEIAPYDVIGITSIFTAQTSRVIEVVKLVKQVDPSKLVVLGGVNARTLTARFFEAGADAICLSEAETTILEIGDALRRGNRDFSKIAGVTFVQGGRVITNPQAFVEQNLDNLPIPAWEMLPLKRYWEIARPHGGGFSPENRIRYGSLMTSRGCPFKCEYCHISKEVEGSPFGNIRSLRSKSVERVIREIDILKDLSVEYVFVEDDSLLAKKKRAMSIFAEIKKRKLTLSDVNGVNVMHLFTKADGKRVVDRELLESMVEAGFRELTLPFESGSQRIIDQYATGKLDLGLDLISLIRTAKELGLIVGGNYTFGYPDETYDELTETIMLAERHMDAGLDRANVMIIVPFPGTVLYEQALAGGYLAPDFDPDFMNWMYPTMKNTIIHPEVLRYVNKICWRLLNHSWRIENISSMALAEAHAALKSLESTA